MRKAVLEAADVLGYVGNSAARALARRRSGLIGVILGDLHDVITAAAFEALEARLAGEGWALLVAIPGPDAFSRDASRELLSQGVEALVFIGAPIADRAAQARIPCIAVDQANDADFVAGAGIDVGRAGALVVDYLASLGHRRIAWVDGPASSPDARFGAAVRAECTATGVTFEVVGSATEPLTQTIGMLTAVNDSPTAAVCASDALALAALLACGRLGVDVPGRLSLVGFGDSPLARLMPPMLTSVRIPAAEAGAAAADYLLARLSGVAVERGELPIKLALRGSTGPAPA